MTRPSLIALLGLAVAAVAALMALDHGDDDAPAQAAKQAQTVPAAEAVPMHPPEFDVVRVDGGDAVIAGHAQPQAEVVIFDGDAEIGHAAVDGRGEWVFVPAAPLTAGARHLRVEARAPDGSTAAGAPVVLVVPEQGGGPALALKTAAQGASRLLLRPSATSPAGTSPAGISPAGLSIEVLDHDDRGRMRVAGKAPPGARLHIYLDNRLLDHAESDADGGWQVSPSGAVMGATGGSHKVRADQVGDKGTVMARVEVAFVPGDDLALTETMGAGTGLAVASLATESPAANPSHALWRIARRTEDGTMYTVIYPAGGDQVRSPATDYPGQVFTTTGR